MHEGTLSKLPPIVPPNSGGHSFLKIVSPAKSKKPKFSMTEAKKAAKLLEGMGKIVTGISVTPEGGFAISAAEPGAIAATEPNEWD